MKARAGNVILAGIGEVMLGDTLIAEIGGGEKVHYSNPASFARRNPTTKISATTLE